MKGSRLTEVDGSGAEAWQLEGSGPEAYERYLVPIMFAPWAEDLLDRVKPAPGERVLDVACGTGAVARRAARRVGAGGRVVGLDVNAAMLAVARREAARDAATLEWREGSAGELPFLDGVFDVATCQQALQFFPDAHAALQEMRRVLAPGGRLAVSVWRGLAHNDAYAVVADALERHAGPEEGAMMRSPFPDWTQDALRERLTEAGFKDVEVRIAVGSVRYPSAAELLRQEAASSPLAGPMAALHEPNRYSLVRALTDALQDHTDDAGVVLPMETHVATARR